MGHLCALVVGYLYAYGFLSFLVPGSYHFESLEQTRMLGWITKIPRFQRAENDGAVFLPSILGGVADGRVGGQYETVPTREENVRQERAYSNPFIEDEEEHNKFPGQGVRLGSN